MIHMATFLEDFGAISKPPDAVSYSDETLETERLESFDKGYRAGWDDALKVRSDDDDERAQGLAQNLQDLSFTYHEAQSQIIASLAPMFEQITDKLLPTLARDTLGPHLVEHLTSLARDMTSGTVKIVVARGRADEVRQLLDDAQIPIKVTVEEADALDAGQADLRLDGKDIAFDLNEVATEISTSVKAAFAKETTSFAYG